MKTGTRSDVTKRLNRITGQVAGLHKMVDGDRGCTEILQQIVAVRSALDQLGVVLLTEHLRTCVLHQNVQDADECCQDLPEEMWSDEIRTALTRFLK